MRNQNYTVLCKLWFVSELEEIAIQSTLTLTSAHTDLGTDEIAVSFIQPIQDSETCLYSKAGHAVTV